MVSGRDVISFLSKKQMEVHTISFDKESRYAGKSRGLKKRAIELGIIGRRLVFKEIQHATK